MKLAEAEGILALEAEISTALRLTTNRDDFLNDWRLQLAAERIVERIFQAAAAFADRHQIGYFGDDGLRYLRGMRNRLAHNYLDVDVDILWNTLIEDIPLVKERMRGDVTAALEIIEQHRRHQQADAAEWTSEHLSPIDDPDD